MTITPLFIMNKFGHFFVVESKIDISKLERCTCFSSLDALLEAAAEYSGYSPDELMGSEIRVLQRSGVLYESTHRGELLPIDETTPISDFLSNYEL